MNRRRKLRMPAHRWPHVRRRPTYSSPAQSDARTLPCAHADTCVAGSNGWAVSGARTASGKPLLSNDMHLSPYLGCRASGTKPTYAPHAHAPAQSPRFTPPESPCRERRLSSPVTISTSHGDSPTWAQMFKTFSSSTLVELRTAAPSIRSAGGMWRAIQSMQHEVIHVRGGADINLDVPLTHHGDMDTPIITSVYPNERRHAQPAMDHLRPGQPHCSIPRRRLRQQTGLPCFSALATWGRPRAPTRCTPTIREHIGYHAVGRIPVRGDDNNPGPLSPVPIDVAAPDAASHEWAGYIPFNELPQALDPADGVLATANARVTLDGYRYPHHAELDGALPHRAYLQSWFSKPVPHKPQQPTLRSSQQPVHLQALSRLSTSSPHPTCSRCRPTSSPSSTR